MNIKRVFTTNEYKNKFLDLNGVIYDQYSALNSFPSLRNKIMEELSKEPSENDEIIKRFYFPEEEEMLKQIEQEKQAIWKKCNVTKPNNNEEAVIMASKIYEYLMQNLTYDQIAQKDRLLNIYSKSEYLKLVEEHQKLTEAGMVKNALSVKAATHLKKGVYTKDKQEDEYDLKAGRDVVLQSVYNTLIRKKEVCFGFTYGYAYLLDGLGFDLKCLNLAKKEDPKEAVHIINLIGLKEEGKTTYYMCDLVDGVTYYTLYKRKDLLCGFMFGLNEYKGAYEEYRISSFEDYNFMDTLGEEFSENKQISALVKRFDKESWQEQIEPEREI